jgi:hypothetical protein
MAQSLYGAKSCRLRKKTFGSGVKVPTNPPLANKGADAVWAQALAFKD